MQKRLNIVGVILGAGKSSRMGSDNKLLAEINGKPMILRVVEAANGSKINKTFLVTGHQRELIQTATQAEDIQFVHNPNFSEGLSSSIKSVSHLLNSDVDGVIVCLGDMPGITSAHINTLINTFEDNSNRHIFIPIFNGKRGNPVLWSNKYFSLLSSLKGDTGARPIFESHSDDILEVEINDDAIHTDLDTPTALNLYRSKFLNK